MRKLNITDWSEDDRPREKLQANGRKSLSNAEYLAILLGSGSVNETAVSLANRILGTVNEDLNKLSRLSVKELCRFKGVGPAKAINIIAAMELGNRKQAHEIVHKPKVFNSPSMIYNYFMPRFKGLETEEMWALFLNRANKILGEKKLSSGGRNGVLCDNKVLMQEALLSKASNFVLLHNHPSGTLHPSDMDIALTKKVYEAAKLLDMTLLDHIIVTDGGFFSFNDENIFPKS